MSRNNRSETALEDVETRARKTLKKEVRNLHWSEKRDGAMHFPRSSYRITTFSKDPRHKESRLSSRLTIPLVSTDPIFGDTECS